MASMVPILSGREVVRVFGEFGWTFSRQRGSHIVLIKPGEIMSLCVPDHKEVLRGTLRGLIRTANLTVQEFADAAK